MTWHIHIEGQVQGVGFRPYVFLLAKEFGLKGWVNNSTNGLHIEINASETFVSEFLGELLKNAPRLAHITNHSCTSVTNKTFETFEIIESKHVGEANLLLTPDFALCSDCRKEIHDKTDKRNNYAFTTCTNCGPRYSIINQLPYDRINTSMCGFEMCQECEQEYENPVDRRFYSQSNSCPKCGISLSLYNDNGLVVNDNQEEIIDLIINYWKEGKIVALKGIGGYILTCDASNKMAILELRKRKNRPSKPLAIMIPSLDNIADLKLTTKIAAELQNHISPIVLMDVSGYISTSNEIAPGLDKIGVVLPYAPLYDLLLNKFDQPIVATSGNISGSPIIYQDDKALHELSKIADYIVVNNRKIVVPQDDSVIRYTSWVEQKIIMRRSRGMAPTYINEELEMPSKNILAMGALIKSTFSFTHQQNCYVSQYLGDLDHFDTQENYKKTISNHLQIFDASPEVILVDKHTHYISTQYGDELSKIHGVPVLKTQHHTAHFGAILGEYNLLHSPIPILGVIWDGTGLGNDGQIWGGEFIKYENYDFLRCYHFDYFDSILGDKMPKEPRISALSTCWDVMGAEDIIKEKFSETEWSIYSHILAKDNPLKTSSVGRIFDAVASLLGIMDKQTFEGEAAMLLESLATQYFKKNGLNFNSSYFVEGAHYYRIPTKSLMTNIIIDLKKGKSKEFIAAKFHFSLMKIVKIVANNTKTNSIAFSGGVFQNGLLVDLMIHHLSKEFQLYFHQELSPNDENISFGQLVCYQIEQHKNTLIKNKKNNHVFSDSR